jgi:hypothetical protein
VEDKKRKAHCQRLPRGATAEERRETHQAKMTRKAERRTRWSLEHARQQSSPRNRVRILANLSTYHPDYGQSPNEHAATKLQRAAGKTSFVSKDQLRNRRQRLARGMGL